MDALLPIGKLARLTGVPVKTIRFYSDEGLLPPSRVAASGYRLYSDADRGRLELIRSLRALDFELPAIRGLLARERPAREVLGLQLQAVDAGLGRLRRARAVLARALESGDDAALVEALRRLQAVAALDGFAREALLRSALDAHLSGVPVDAGWKAQLYDAAFKGLPEELSEAQWAALLELVELVRDPGFGARLAEGSRGFWAERQGPFDLKAWNARHASLVARANAALEAGEPPASPRGRALAGALVAAFAEGAGKRPTPAFARRLLERAARHDPRGERFWELVGVLRGWRQPSPTARAFRWLFAALAAHGADLTRAGARPAVEHGPGRAGKAAAPRRPGARRAGAGAAPRRPAARAAARPPSR